MPPAHIVVLSELYQKSAMGPQEGLVLIPVAVCVAADILVALPAELDK